MMLSNALRSLWREGGVAYGAFIFTRLDPVMVEAIGRLGYDYICIDMQHGLMAFGDLLAMVQAIAITKTTPIVRVPANDPAIIGRVLDAGALGVIIPMVNSAAEAERAVAACRYAPLGIRSFGPVAASIRYGRDYIAMANDNVLCIPMIETAEAARVASEIVAIPGVDAVYIGPTDLSLTYGMPPALDNAGEFAAALAAVAGAAAAHGVIPGIHASAELAAARRDGGFRMVTVANDLSVMNVGFTAELRDARSAVAATQRK